MNQFNAGSANQMIQNQLNRNRVMDQFNQNMDFQRLEPEQPEHEATARRIRSDCLTRCSAGRVLASTQRTTFQNTPLNYWQQFAQGAGNLGGVGGTIDQTGTTAKRTTGQSAPGWDRRLSTLERSFGGGK